MKPTLLLLLIAATAGACATSATQQRPPQYYDQSNSQASGAAPAGLFSGDAAVLNDEQIGKILSFRYKAPKQSRIAILPFGREQWGRWSKATAIASDGVRQRVIKKLVASPRIYDASYLPSILTPEKRTVPFLREAAARYQADLLFMYRPGCRTFSKYRVFSPSKTRAYCTVESVLLDTRTGLVPFTAVSNQVYEVNEQKSDINLREAALRSQLTAIETGLSEITDKLVGFIDNK